MFEKFKKLKVAFEVFKAGKKVVNPKRWKKGQVTVEGLSAFLLAIIAAVTVYFDVDVQVGEQTVDSASTALIALVGAGERLYSVISTVITTDKLGVRSKNKSNN